MWAAVKTRRDKIPQGAANLNTLSLPAGCHYFLRKFVNREIKNRGDKPKGKGNHKV